METFAWQGRTIAWDRVGSGPPVVMCHGTPWSSVVWAPYAEALSGDFTVHTWDMPGYGRSSRHAEHRTDFGSQAQAFAALLEHWRTDWGLERPHVVAHDFGGAVSLRTTLVEGATYASLLLADVVAIPPSGSPFFRYVHDHAEVLEQLPGYVHRAVVRDYIQGASHRGLREDDLAALVDPWTGEEGEPAFYRQIAHYDESFLEDNEARLGQLDLPVRVVWGEDDPWIPVSMAQRLADLIDGATVRLVPGAGHLIQYDAPVALADELRSWLTQVSSDREDAR